MKRKGLRVIGTFPPDLGFECDKWKFLWGGSGVWGKRKSKVGKTSQAKISNKTESISKTGNRFPGI